MPATVLDISGNGMRLRVPAKVPGGAGIKIDSKNALVRLKSAGACGTENPTRSR